MAKYKHKMLLDVGSPNFHSLIQTLHYKYFPNLIRNDTVKIKTNHGESFGKYSIKNFFLELFRTNKALIFYLYNFHNQFD